MARFSIVMPVLNGGNYIKESVKSILSQNVADFTLHILDSGSTDGTIEWLNTLSDPRIIIYPAATRLTIEQNWSRMKTIPRNEWMTVFGHDDILYPNYLEVMQSHIAKYPGAALIGTHFDFINGDGNFIKKVNPMKEKYTAQEFTEKLITNEVGVVSVMCRSVDFDKIGGVPEFPGLLFSDFPWHIELGRLSYAVIAPQSCLAYRLHSTSMTGSSNYEVYYRAFKKYIHYLVELKNAGADYSNIVSKTSTKLLRKRGTEFINKLLYTSPGKRGYYKTIGQLIKEQNEFATMLTGNNDFDLGQERSVKIAKVIDKTLLTRWLFKVAKKIFKGPLLNRNSV